MAVCVCVCVCDSDAADRVVASVADALDTLGDAVSEGEGESETDDDAEMFRVPERLPMVRETVAERPLVGDDVDVADSVGLAGGVRVGPLVSDRVTIRVDVQLFWNVALRLCDSNEAEASCDTDARESV